MEKDIVIIGGGVVGSAVARLLSKYEGSVAVLEGKSDIAEGASKANSGIVHAGFDAKPGSMKAKLNVEGAKMYPALCEEVNAPYRRAGAMVLAFSEEERPTVQKLYEQGVANGVPEVRIIEHDEILAMEPNVNPGVVCALLAPTSGITSPYELTCALADHAAVNGVEFCLDTRVEDICEDETGYTLKTNQGPVHAKVIINCAGVNSAKLHNLLSDDKLTIIPRKGEYYLLDRIRPLLFSRTMFQTPTKMGKGVLVSPTVHGNILVGPSATDVEDGEAVETTAEGLAGVLSAARKTWPNVRLNKVITTFAGMRAHETNGDFIIGAVKGRKNAYETVGIESPGLSAAPAIAEMLVKQIAEEQGLKEKAQWLPAPVREKPFYDMTDEERAEIVKKDPEYGTLVCRCEQVTEAEIRAAIRRPVGARTIDAVKRRTRAGMGRCQGGFCSPRVLEILSEELNISPLEVTKCGVESRLLVGTLAESFPKEEA